MADTRILEMERGKRTVSGRRCGFLRFAFSLSFISISTTMSAKSLILSVLEHSQIWLACHELHVPRYSENCVATRLSELQAEGKIKSRYREGKRFKEWTIAMLEN